MSQEPLSCCVEKVGLAITTSRVWNSLPLLTLNEKLFKKNIDSALLVKPSVTRWLYYFLIFSHWKAAPKDNIFPKVGSKFCQTLKTFNHFTKIQNILLDWRNWFRQIWWPCCKLTIANFLPVPTTSTLAQYFLNGNRLKITLNHWNFDTYHGLHALLAYLHEVNSLWGSRLMLLVLNN